MKNSSPKSHEEIIIALIDTISRCANSEIPWENFLAQMTKSFPSLKSAIVGYDLQGMALNLAITDNYDPDFMESYENYYHTINPWVDLHKDMPPPHQVKWAHLSYPHENLVQTEFFNDWVKPQENVAYGFSVGLINQKDRVVTLNSNFNIQYMEEAQRAAAVMNVVGPVLQRSFEMYRRLQGQKLQLTTQETVLNRLHCAIFILNEKNNILYANTKAEDVLQQTDVIKIDRSKSLYFTNTKDQNAVFPQLGKDGCARHKVQESSTKVGTKQLYETYTKLLHPIKSPYIALITPYENPEDHEIKRFAYLIRPERQYILMLINPSAEKRVATGLIKVGLGLTDTQAKVAIGLYHGNSLEDIAKANNIVLSTVKKHLQNINNRTGLTSQADLIISMAKVLA